MSQPVPYSPPTIFAGTFVIASVAGLSQLIRSGRKLSWRSCIAAGLTSGIAGLAVNLLLWERYATTDDGVWLLMGIGLLAGLGGIDVTAFLLELVKGNVKVDFKVEQKTKNGK